MPFDPYTTGPNLRGTRPSPTPPGFDPAPIVPNAGGGVWGSDRPMPESETRPSSGSSWNRRSVFRRVGMAVLRGSGRPSPPRSATVGPDRHPRPRPGDERPGPAGSPVVAD